MKKLLTNYHPHIVYLLLTLQVSGQQLPEAVVEADHILLNDLAQHARLSVRKDTLYLAAQSLRQEPLQVKITKRNKLIRERVHELHYGMNSIRVPLTGMEADLQKGDVFHVHFSGRYFGKGNFELLGDPVPVMESPQAGIQAHPLDVNCDKRFTSSMEFWGKVHGGSAPYQLTWLVSKGPKVKDLINQPLDFSLTNSEDVSRLVVEESLDYYVTLLVADACGNKDKQVMHIKCREDEEEGMVYFQLIDSDRKPTNTNFNR